MTTDLHSALQFRFQDHTDVPDQLQGAEVLAGMADRGSCRAFTDQRVPTEVLETLCAVALSSPTKSDLQQRDIVLMTSAGPRKELADMVTTQPWVTVAPMIAVFCGNNRRQRLSHAWHDIPFANDHLDAFFNASVDAAIALGAFVTAAESIGLGCCPISGIRDQAAAVSRLLNLPQHVFPVAGLAVGYPAAPKVISKRLPLAATVHLDTYQEEDLQQTVNAYDTDRALTQPYAHQRYEDRFGTAAAYGWSMDKVRQYSAPERADFGAFIRAKGFNLD
ncbi:MAG: nitroreductase family protein [Yoonia sp.]|uniref:nitroreductase family protein n=1 Tax=Yoonia sp. TaxID=2212373 RepID=UPI0032654106